MQIALKRVRQARDRYGSAPHATVSDVQGKQQSQQKQQEQQPFEVVVFTSLSGAAWCGGG